MAKRKARYKKLVIDQPNGQLIRSKFGNVKLVWNKDFKSKWENRFENVQKFVDSECIRKMRPYTPYRNGILEKSAKLGTQIGSGMIHQVAPYARFQYYGKVMVSSKTGSAWSRGESKIVTSKDLVHDKSRHALAGPFWFERMKADHKKKILSGAKRLSKKLAGDK